MEGDIDLRGLTGVAGDVPKGYKSLRVTFRVRSDAPEETLLECARYSPVYSTLKDCVPIELKVEKK